MGAGLSLLVGGALAGVLEGVESNDPVVLVLATGLLFLAVLAAAFLQTHRATRVDPAASLQGE